MQKQKNSLLNIHAIFIHTVNELKYIFLTVPNRYTNNDPLAQRYVMYRK